MPCAEPLICGYRGEGKKILIVDDKWENRSVLINILKPLGFEVAEAGNGNEALEQFASWQPDLILMDLALPGIDGWEATRLLKGAPETSHLLIVALSAHALATEGERARAAGCDGFIAKPCLPSDLVEEIGNYLKSQPAARARRPRVRRH